MKGNQRFQEASGTERNRWDGCLERPLSSAPRQAATCKCTHSGTSSIPPPGKRHSRWDRGGSRAVWHCQQELGPAIRDRISALKLFYTFSLALAAAQASSSCLSLRVNTSSGALLSPHCWQVVGSVCIAELEPVQLEGNQLYQDEFLCPEAVAGQ